VELPRLNSVKTPKAPLDRAFVFCPWGDAFF
jgi:hypothetical protein